MILYFTGTGNSQYVADGLAVKLLDEVVCSNDLIKKGETGEFHSDKPWVFVFPVYLSTIAKIFANFICASAFSGNTDAYFIATCASSMGSVPNACSQICSEKGFTYKGTEKVQMPQNYIALFKMTEKEECERRYEAAEKVIEQIGNKILRGEILDAKLVSKAEYTATKLVEKMYNGPFTQTKKFYASDACIGCGLCEKVCPLNNIEMIDGKPGWIKSCVHCMACINRCPKQAIEYGKGTVGKTRYVCKTYK